MLGIADGVDRYTSPLVARRVLRDHRPHPGDFPTGFP